MVLVTAMETGGLEVFLVRILQVIDRTKFNVAIVCTGRDSNWYADELDALGVRTVYCHNAYSQVGFVRRIRQVMKDLKTHVVCDFRDDFAAPTLLAARQLGIKNRIAMYRNTDRLFKPSLFRNLYSRAMHYGTSRWATQIIGNSKSVLDAFYPDWASCDKCAVAYNGVDLNEFRPGRDGAEVRREHGISQDALLVGHVGRFNAQKNHRVLLSTFSGVHTKLSNAHLILVGDGDLRSAIEQQIADLSLHGSVTLAGRRKDVSNVLAAIDVYLFPSLNEGHPNALIEAMACGLPVVASDIAPVRESMPPGCADDLYPPEDATGMTQRVIYYAQSAADRQRAGAHLRQHVEREFSLEVAAERLCAHWARAL